MSNANAVAQRDPIKDLQADLSRDTVKAQFALALPVHITPDKFVRTLMTAVAKNPDLAQADRRSLFNSCLEAAADGLMPNGKEAALVIFNTKDGKDDRGRDIWIKKVQYMPMVRGIRKLAFNSGQLKVLDAFCVHANDHFDYEYGFDPNVTHKPPKLGQDRGPIIGVYAVSETKDGERSLEVMDRAAVEKVRAVSRSKDRGPWVDWWDEMARKTVLRRLAKRLPLSEELERAINRDDALYEVEKRREAEAALPSPATSTAAGQLSAFAASPMLEHDDAPEPQDDATPTDYDPKTGEVFEQQPQEGAAEEKPADKPVNWPAKISELKSIAKACKTVQELIDLKQHNKATIEAMPDDVFPDWADFAEARAAELKGNA
ncbi:recombinase RecT [Azospirillum palustre]